MKIILFCDFRLVEIAMEAMDLLLLACHAQNLNLFVESFLKVSVAFSLTLQLICNDYYILDDSKTYGGLESELANNGY